MRKKEKLSSDTTEIFNALNPDEQRITDLIQKRKLQQDALKKIITSMDKSGHDEKNKDPEGQSS